MQYFKRPLGLGFLLLMIVMALQVVTKKPLCVDSPIVYKIDRLSAAGIETLYSCEQNKITRFSPYFYENMNLLNYHLAQAEAKMAQIGLQNKLEITLDEINLAVVKIQNQKLTIGANLIDTPAFEKALLKASLFSRVKLENEALLDFLVDVVSASKETEENVFSEIWSQAYQKLNSIEQIKFQLSILQNIRKIDFFSKDSLVDNMFLILGVQPNITLSKFKKILTENLKQIGLLQNNAEFDLVIESRTGNVNIEDLMKLSKQHPELRVAYQDKLGFFTLPYLIKIDSDVLKQVHAELRVLIESSDGTTSELSAYLNNTERLILLNVGQQPTSIDYRQLFNKKYLDFLIKNKQLEFVQFHMPSYRARAKNLVAIKNYFSFLKQNKSVIFKQKGLGWNDSEWVADMQAYKPIAIYDVIQYYRVN